MTDSEYILALDCGGPFTDPVLKAHSERLRDIAAKLARQAPAPVEPEFTIATLSQAIGCKALSLFEALPHATLNQSLTVDDVAAIMAHLHSKAPAPVEVSRLAEEAKQEFNKFVADYSAPGSRGMPSGAAVFAAIDRLAMASTPVGEPKCSPTLTECPYCRPSEPEAQKLANRVWLLTVMGDWDFKMPAGAIDQIASRLSADRAPETQKAVAWQCRRPGGSWGPPFTNRKHVEAFLADDYEVRALGVIDPSPAASMEVLARARAALNYVDECCSRTIPCAIELDRVNDVVAEIDALAAKNGWRLGEGQ